MNQGDKNKNLTKFLRHFFGLNYIRITKDKYGDYAL